MSTKHIQQALKGDLLGALQHLEEVADHIVSAQKIVEAQNYASTNNDYATALRIYEEYRKRVPGPLDLQAFIRYIAERSQCGNTTHNMQ